MPMSQPVQIGGEWGSYAFTDGFKPARNLPTHWRQEALRGPVSAEAVFNRLTLQERWDEAEAFLDDPNIQY